MSSMLNEAINEKHNEGAMVNALAGMPIKEVRQKLREMTSKAKWQEVMTFFGLEQLDQTILEAKLGDWRGDVSVAASHWASDVSRDLKKLNPKKQPEQVKAKLCTKRKLTRTSASAGTITM
ncbi:MAG: hypothetical protein II352_01290 [Selenomonadaceae bacterium]|nr:hypothetical protein [Selenomonadaceae bacterium]